MPAIPSIPTIPKPDGLKLQAPAPPQIPVPEGIPAPIQELGYAGQRALGQAQRSLNGILNGGNPIIEMISGVQSAIQNIPLPVEFVAQLRRGIRNARFPFAELADGEEGLSKVFPFPKMSGNVQEILPKLPGIVDISGGSLGNAPGEPTGQRENRKQIPVF